MKFDIVRAEERSATVYFVLGKLVMSAPKEVLKQIVLLLLECFPANSAKVNDVLRIAGIEEVDLPDAWKRRQRQLLSADAELAAKQQQSAALSREAIAKKRRLRQEQEERDAADRAAFENWRRSRSFRPDDPIPPEDDYPST